MRRLFPLIIHKSEWERIKNQANPDKDITKIHCKVDIEAMNAQSQKWISSWTNLAQGQAKKASIRNEKARLEEMKEVEAFYKRKKRDETAKNLRRARDLIFERTGHGKELLSALLESKILEEREIQIQFKKKITEEEKKIEETKVKVDNIMYAELEKRENERLLKKQNEREDAECNKLIAEMKKRQALKIAEMEKKNLQEDAILIEIFNQLQVAEEHNDHWLDKEAVKTYEEQNKAIREMREKREALDQVLADLWCNHKDRIRRREKQVFDQIYRNEHDTGYLKENYELVKRLQVEEEKKYKDFIDKGVKKFEKRLQNKEKQDKLKEDQKRNMMMMTTPAQCVQHNNQRECENYRRRISVDKQSFLPSARRGKLDSKLQETKEPQPLPPRPQFTTPSTALQESYKRRQAEPSRWSGTTAAHDQFGSHAASILAEAKYKRPVLKVIESYCKTNNVKDLKIPNLS